MRHDTVKLFFEARPAVLHECIEDSGIVSPTPQFSVPVSRANPPPTPATGLSVDRSEDSRTSGEPSLACLRSADFQPCSPLQSGFRAGARQASWQRRRGQTATA
jgi:hypothetical protein